MEEPNRLATLRELLPLTDSLASRIRWRVCDYAALVSAELELMLGSTTAEDAACGASRVELRSAIRVLGGGPRIQQSRTRAATTLIGHGQGRAKTTITDED